MGRPPKLGDDSEAVYWAKLNIASHFHNLAKRVAERQAEGRLKAKFASSEIDEMLGEFNSAPPPLRSRIIEVAAISADAEPNDLPDDVREAAGNLRDRREVLSTASDSAAAARRANKTGHPVSANYAARSEPIRRAYGVRPRLLEETALWASNHYSVNITCRYVEECLASSDKEMKALSE